MKYFIWQTFKLASFAFLILTLQLAVLKELSPLNFNLPLVAIITIASIASLEVSLYSASFFVIAISLLSYNSTFYWTFLVAAFITNQFSPKNLEDKFLIAAFYCAVFTPVFEILYSPVKEALINKCIFATLINLATLIPIYFILKFVIVEKKRNLYI